MFLVKISGILQYIWLLTYRRVVSAEMKASAGWRILCSRAVNETRKPIHFFHLAVHVIQLHTPSQFHSSHPQQCNNFLQISETLHIISITIIKHYNLILAKAGRQTSTSCDNALALCPCLQLQLLYGWWTNSRRLVPQTAARQTFVNQTGICIL